MVKVFLFFTILIIFACSPIHVGLATKSIKGYWRDTGTGHKYWFKDNGELDYYIRLTKYSRRWELHTTNLNHETQLYIAVYDSNMNHIETYVPTFIGSDTIKMDGLLGDYLLLERIE